MKAIQLALLFLFLSEVSLAQSYGGSGSYGGGGGKSGSSTRGVDFRMQLNSGVLDFTGISGIQRKFKGFGSELSAHFYVVENTRFRTNLFLSTRVMSYTGEGVAEGETDDLQLFTVAPGLEIAYGMLHLSAAYQAMNVNSYFVSSFSSGRTFAMSAPVVSAHLNFRMGHLGLGIGASQSKFSMDPSKLGLAADRTSTWDETFYSLNVIYFIGSPPGKFFKELFK